MSIKFVFLILPKVHLLDLAGPNQAILEAIEFGADFEIEYCGINQSIITSSMLPLGNILSFEKTKLKKGDYIIISGSDYQYSISKDFLNQENLFKWLIKNHQLGVNLCSICLGAFVLAKTGLLDDKLCTTHFKKTKELKQLYPKLKVAENILYTDEENIYTSAGIASGIDLMLHIIEKIKGSYLAHKLARELVVYKRRNGNSSQESVMLMYRNHIHNGIHKVQDYLNENIHQKNALSSISEIANLSERHFSRLFVKETGINLSKYIQKIRKEKIKELIKNPNLSRIEIANKVGLKSEKQLYRILKSND